MVRRISATARAVRVLAIVVFLAATTVPLRAQRERHVEPFWSQRHNAVSRIGAATSTGAVLGLSVTLAVLVTRAIEPDSAPSMQVARWSFVGGTFAGFALGAIWNLAVPSDPQPGSIGASASAVLGGLGGFFLGVAFPFALYRNPPTGLAVGSMWTGILGGSIAGFVAGREGSPPRPPVGEAAISIASGRHLSLALPMPAPALGGGRASGAHLRLVSYHF